MSSAASVSQEFIHTCSHSWHSLGFGMKGSAVKWYVDISFLTLKKFDKTTASSFYFGEGILHKTATQYESLYSHIRNVFSSSKTLLLKLTAKFLSVDTLHPELGNTTPSAV